MPKFLAISLLIIMFVLGVGTGYLISPQYGVMSEKATESMDLGVADKYFDLRYASAMIAHHRGAMQLAAQVKDQTRRPEIKALAEEILASEPAAIDSLYQWRKDWYQDYSAVADKAVVNLGSFDEKLDQRFLNALLAHHQAGITMAEEAKYKSNRNEVLNNADAVISFLSGGVKTFKGWLTQWYGISFSDTLGINTTAAPELTVTPAISPAPNKYDLEYTSNMIAIYKGDLKLAETVKAQTRRPELKQLAGEVEARAQKAVADLEQWRKAWGQEQADVASVAVADLGTYDEYFDLKFINALLGNDEMALNIVEYTKLASGSKEVLQNTGTIQETLEKGIAKLKEWRTQWYRIS